MKKKELDNMLDKIAAGIRSEQVDDGAVNEATGRVGRGWRAKMRAGCARTACKMQALRPSIASKGARIFNR